MIRIKTFDATGVAPNGRLFAGDLNAIQDAVAALTDLTQNMQVASIAIGESGLQLVRFGAGEARITGSARVDGILRGLSGLYAGQYTTTQRDAIPVGARPTGLIVYNATTGRPEYNAGTDPTPSWQPIGAAASTSGPLVNIPAAGSVSSGSFYYANDQDVLYRSTGAAWVRVGSKAGDIVITLNTVAATGRLLGQGQTVARTGLNADLFALWGTTYNTGGEAGTDFRLPDLRGRMPVLLGTHADVATIGQSDGQAVANRRPKHRTTNALGAPTHTLTLPNHGHSITDPGHQHALASIGGGNNTYALTQAAGDNSALQTLPATTGITVGNPTSTPTIPGAITAPTGSIGTNNANDNLDAPSYFVVNGEIKL